MVNADPGFDLVLTVAIRSGSYQGLYLDAGGGNDTLSGAGAPDILVGGSGTDILKGGDGSDILRGGAGNDTLDGQGATGNFDLIDLSDASAGFTFALGASGNGSFNGTAVGLGTDTYSNMEGVIGSDFNDLLTGNASDNEIRGGLGNDTINGGLGNDTLIGNAGNDVFVFNTALNAATNVDQLMDFNAGGSGAGAVDKINLDDAVFVGIANLSGSLNPADFVASAGGNARQPPRTSCTTQRPGTSTMMRTGAAGAPRSCSPTSISWNSPARSTRAILT